MQISKDSSPNQEVQPCASTTCRKKCALTLSGTLFVTCTSQAVPSTKDPLWNKPRSQISASKFLCYLETFAYFFKLKFHMDDKDSQGCPAGVTATGSVPGQTGCGTGPVQWWKYRTRYTATQMRNRLVAWTKALGDLKPWQEHTALDRCAVISFAGRPHLQGQLLSWYFPLKRAY